MAWPIHDMRMQDGINDHGMHVVAHPPKASDREVARHTRLNDRNLARWARTWDRDSRWDYVENMTRPLLQRLNLGSGDTAIPGWRNLDPRAGELGNGAERWSFDEMVPLTDNKADVVLTSHVFEFVSEDRYQECMLDIWRVLRPGAVWRLAEIETSGGFYWRPLGAETRIGTVRSMPSRERLKRVAEAIGFKWHDSRPGETLSPHTDVLLGDSRPRRFQRGQKFYAECVKDIVIEDLARARWRDPRAPRWPGRYHMPKAVASL
jgi:hypothetical protein